MAWGSKEDKKEQLWVVRSEATAPTPPCRGESGCQGGSHGHCWPWDEAGLMRRETGREWKGGDAGNSHLRVGEEPTGEKRKR